MASILEEGKPSVFYKAPIPLIFGNIPLADDFKEHKDEYHYFNYYIVPSQYTNNNTLALNRLGIVFYSEYLKNYVYMRGTSSVDLTWKNLYPYFSLDHYYYLNPFVNVDGACTWIYETDYEFSPQNIYFNFEKDRFEYGLGADVVNYEDCNLSPIAISYPTLDQNDVRVSTTDELKNFSLISNTDTTLTSYKFFPNHFLNNGVVISSPDEIPSGASFQCKPINSNGKSPTSTGRLYQAYSSDLKYQYIRTEDIPDFDFLNDPEKYENMCGIYKNNENKKFVLGSIIIGNVDNPNFGYFIGVNGLVTSIPGLNTTYSSTPIGATNVYSTADGDYIVHLGYNITGDTKKSIVFLRTENTEGLFKKDRVFIFDGYPEELFSVKKLWYAELPDMKLTIYAPYLFEKPFSYFGTTFTDLTFNYVNLDNEEDSKSPISLDVVGATRINPNLEILGISLNKRSVEDINRPAAVQTNVYIGYWKTPMTKIIEE